MSSHAVNHLDLSFQPCEDPAFPNTHHNNTSRSLRSTRYLFCSHSSRKELLLSCCGVSSVSSFSKKKKSKDRQTRLWDDGVQLNQRWESEQL
jgi:hypothetical protein